MGDEFKGPRKARKGSAGDRPPDDLEADERRKRVVDGLGKSISLVKRAMAELAKHSMK
jgi:hypothetical protein